MITANEIKAKYWALEVISSHNQNDMSNISGTLGTSKIDLNPHQIEAALFALKSPLSQGVIVYSQKLNEKHFHRLLKIFQKSKE